MRYRLECLDRQTGRAEILDLDATSEEDAVSQACDGGWIVAGVEVVDAASTRFASRRDSRVYAVIGGVVVVCVAIGVITLLRSTLSAHDSATTADSPSIGFDLTTIVQRVGSNELLTPLSNADVFCVPAHRADEVDTILMKYQADITPRLLATAERSKQLIAAQLRIRDLQSQSDRLGAEMHQLNIDSLTRQIESGRYRPNQAWNDALARRDIVQNELVTLRLVLPDLESRVEDALKEGDRIVGRYHATVQTVAGQLALARGKSDVDGSCRIESLQGSIVVYVFANPAELGFWRREVSVNHDRKLFLGPDQRTEPDTANFTDNPRWRNPVTQ